MTVSGKVVFDDLGRVVQQGQPVFETGYNAAFTNYLTAKNPTLFTYDPLDRTTIVMTPDAKGPSKYATTTTTYGFGQVNATSSVYATTKVVDPIGNAVGGGKGTKVSFKDVDDRIVAVVEYNNTIPIITTYEYDPLGQITAVWDDKKNQTTIAYDQLGRRTMINNPDTGKTVSVYDNASNVKVFAPRTDALISATETTSLNQVTKDQFNAILAQHNPLTVRQVIAMDQT